MPNKNFYIVVVKFINSPYMSVACISENKDKPTEPILHAGFVKEAIYTQYSRVLRLHNRFRKWEVRAAKAGVEVFKNRSFIYGFDTLDEIAGVLDAKDKEEPIQDSATTSAGNSSGEDNREIQPEEG